MYYDGNQVQKHQQLRENHAFIIFSGANGTLTPEHQVPQFIIISGN